MISEQYLRTDHDLVGQVAGQTRFVSALKSVFLIGSFANKARTFNALRFRTGSVIDLGYIGYID